MHIFCTYILFRNSNSTEKYAFLLQVLSLIITIITIIIAVVVDVVNEFAREGALSELLYTDDLVRIPSIV